MAYKASFWKKALRKLRLMVGQLFLTAKKEQTGFSREIITMTTL
ncbi:MAG: hypothetical protein AAB506_02585 [Patescibacteria group bacterium]